MQEHLTPPSSQRELSAQAQTGLASRHEEALVTAVESHGGTAGSGSCAPAHLQRTLTGEPAVGQMPMEVVETQVVTTGRPTTTKPNQSNINQATEMFMYAQQRNKTHLNYLGKSKCNQVNSSRLYTKADTITPSCGLECEPL